MMFSLFNSTDENSMVGELLCSSSNSNSNKETMFEKSIICIPLSEASLNHADSQTMEEVKNKRNSFEKKFLEDTRDRLFAHSFTESDSILLYLVKYGRDYVRDYRLSYKRKI